MVASTTSTAGTNIDVAGIVSQLMAVEQKPLTALSTKEASYNAQLSAYGSIKGALGSFQTAVSALSDISKFKALSATSGDSTILTASATTDAVAGVYAVSTTQLAQAQTLMSNGVMSNTVSLGNSATTLSFQFGTTGVPGSFGTAKTVAIAANSSLQDISSAVNAANIGVSATVVNDGTATPYRLVFTASSTGAANSMSVVTADATLSPILNYDEGTGGTKSMTQAAAAQNAMLTVNGVPVSSATNTVTGAIQGVTLSLVKPNAATSVTIVRDTATINTSVSGFVKAYNDLSTTLKNLSAYDPVNKKGAVLLGDSTVSTLQSKLRVVLNTAISNSGASLTTLSQIGVSFQKDGTLALDAAKLNTAISNNFNDIASLFAVTGKATDNMVAYSASTTSTLPGSYAIHVDSLAAQGNTTGGVNLNTVNGTGLTAIAANTVINVTLDNVSASVALTAGTYTASQLATMVQSAINSTSAFSAVGSSIAATIDGSGQLVITSNRYSSTSNASMASGTGTSVLDFMGAATTASGADVAGTIDGQVAIGAGQTLTASTGNTKGLKIQINGGTFGAGAAGDRGTMNYSQGYAYTLNQLATSLLASDGLLAGRTTGINNSITDIGKQRDAMNTRLARMQANYTKQFTALDVMLSGMNTTMNFLTQQLAKL